MTRYRLIAGRLRSTGWERHSSPVMTPDATGAYTVPLRPVVNRWERSCFRCRFEFDHIAPDAGPDSRPAPDFKPFVPDGPWGP